MQARGGSQEVEIVSRQPAERVSVTQEYFYTLDPAINLEGRFVTLPTAAGPLELGIDSFEGRSINVQWAPWTERSGKFVTLRYARARISLVVGRCRALRRGPIPLPARPRIALVVGRCRPPPRDRSDPTPRIQPLNKI